MNKFKVMTVAEFLDDGPPIGSREFKRELAEEKRQANKREALAEQRRNAYQQYLDTLSPVERAYEELDALLEFTDTDDVAPGIRGAVDYALQQLKELEK